MKSSSEHIPFLDLIRGVAILLVFLAHSVPLDPAMGPSQSGWAGWFRDFNVPLSHLAIFPATLGWAGVPIFFVVSGFCIHLSHERSRDREFDIFFLRRFFRIYPPYLVALLIFALVFPWSKLNFSFSLIHTHSQFLYSIISLAAHLTLTHNFFRYLNGSINPAFWSIAVEVQLYLLYPILLVLAKNFGWCRILWITGVIEFGLRGFSSLYHVETEWLVYNPFYFWFSWSIGAALAEANLKGKPLPFACRSLLIFPLLFLIFYLVQPLSSFCFTLAALSTVCVISYLLKHPDRIPSRTGRRAFLVNHLHYVGLVSYSLYLIHMPILTLIDHLTQDLAPNHQVPYLVMFVICAISWFFVLIPSYLSYRFLELPSIELGKWFIERRRRIKAMPDKQVQVFF